LAAAFRKGGLDKVRSLHRDNSPDETAWCAGEGWWLSTGEAMQPEPTS
jgi:protein-L-isoaspartate(D-aspartate) O-methyltransferase